MILVATDINTAASVSPVDTPIAAIVFRRHSGVKPGNSIALGR